MNIGVIQFPGSNCESETQEALHNIGVPYSLIPWNSEPDFNQFTGIVLPGGFSFQDRVRAGVIAAKLPIIQSLKKYAKTKTLPILGICNGAQILMEAGFFSVDHTLDGIVDLNYINEHAIGFVSDWGFLTPFHPSKNIFLEAFSENDILPIQICHGEGRFLMHTLPTSGLRYTTIHGQTSAEFPTTPNGAFEALGAVSNDTGNVLAIMPHPERSCTPNRYPHSIKAYAKRHHLNLIDFKELFKGFTR